MMIFCENSQLLSQKNSTVDVRLGSKYVSRIKHQIPSVFHNSGILIYPRTMNVLCYHKRAKLLKVFMLLNYFLLSKYTQHSM